MEDERDEVAILQAQIEDLMGMVRRQMNLSNEKDVKIDSLLKQLRQHEKREKKVRDYYKHVERFCKQFAIHKADAQIQTDPEVSFTHPAPVVASTVRRSTSIEDDSIIVEKVVESKTKKKISTQSSNAATIHISKGDVFSSEPLQFHQTVAIPSISGVNQQVAFHSAPGSSQAQGVVSLGMRFPPQNAAVPVTLVNSVQNDPRQSRGVLHEMLATNARITSQNMSNQQLQFHQQQQQQQRAHINSLQRHQMNRFIPCPPQQQQQQQQQMNVHIQSFVPAQPPQQQQRGFFSLSETGTLQVSGFQDPTQFFLNTCHALRIRNYLPEFDEDLLLKTDIDPYKGIDFDMFEGDLAQALRSKKLDALCALPKATHNNKSESFRRADLLARKCCYWEQTHKRKFPCDLPIVTTNIMKWYVILPLFHKFGSDLTKSILDANQDKLFHEILHTLAGFMGDSNMHR